MTKDILLTISGLHETEGQTDDPVETISPGQYYLKNGKHYILFDEVMEGLEGSVRSTIKFSEERMELLRTGAAATRMIFQKGQEHSAVYQTAAGPLMISVYTEEFKTKVSDEQVELEVRYSLKAGEQVLTESVVRIHVCPKENKEF